MLNSTLYFFFLGILLATLLSAPSGCSLIGSLWNKDYSYRKFAYVHFASGFRMLDYLNTTEQPCKDIDDTTSGFDNSIATCWKFAWSYVFSLEEILMKYFDKRGLELRSCSSPDRDSQLGLFLKLGRQWFGAEDKTCFLRYLIIWDLDQWRWYVTKVRRACLLRLLEKKNISMNDFIQTRRMID